MDVEKILSKWADETKFERSELKSWYDENYKNLPSMQEETRQKEALKLILFKLENLSLTKAVLFEGIVLGDNGAFDKVAKKRAVAIEAFKNNKEQAIKDGLTDEKGRPLDTQEKFFNGDLNPNYKKLLPESNSKRNLLIKAKEKGTDSDPSLMQMTLYENKLYEKVILGEPAKFLAAKSRRTGDGIVYLNSVQNTKFEPDGALDIPKKDGKVDIEAIIGADFDILEIAKLEEYHEKNKENYNRLIASKGHVINIGGGRKGNSVLTLVEQLSEDFENINAAEEKKTLTCWGNSSIDFSNINIGDEVLVLGKTNKGTNEDGSLKDISMNISGAFVIKPNGVEIKELTEKDLMEEDLIAREEAEA